MYEAVRLVASEYGVRLDDDARYVAFMALRHACERDRRYPTSDEARRVVADAWTLAT